MKCQSILGGKIFSIPRSEVYSIYTQEECYQLPRPQGMWRNCFYSVNSMNRKAAYNRALTKVILEYQAAQRRHLVCAIHMLACCRGDCGRLVKQQSKADDSTFLPVVTACRHTCKKSTQTKNAVSDNCVENRPILYIDQFHTITTPALVADKALSVVTA